MPPKTMFEKIWGKHVVHQEHGKPALIYIDLHLVHEITSAQAFDGLRLANRTVRRPQLTIATVDHNVPTWERSKPSTDPLATEQMETLDRNARQHKLPYYDIHSEGQGIVHVIGPEQGHTQPGKTIVCGDSHTSTHGAFGALAFGIGTSEVEHVLATQCLLQAKPKVMEIRVDGPLPKGVSAKDIILAIIAEIGVAGAVGHVVEYTGQAIRDLSMEGRMTVSNMTIEAGARAGMIAPDEITFSYCEGRPRAPKGADWDRAVDYWKTLPTDDGAVFDKEVILEAEKIAPQVTWGTNPEEVAPIDGVVPDPVDAPNEDRRRMMQRSLDYMGLAPGMAMTDVTIDRAFIGSCTNSRIEDLEAAAAIARGRKVADGVEAMVVPGSGLVKEQAEARGLDKIFTEAGFDWREPGCSMCVAMNGDYIQPGQRCASTSNRNFEGRQGRDGRTHLASPAMVAAAAVTGRLTDVRVLETRSNE